MPRSRYRVESRRQGGYILLSLLLTCTLLIIAAAAAAPSIARQIRRDREEELIHRGTQYRRAIRRFIKQTGRYPMRVEDLDTGSVRYLRKRYKDPITGEDFKLLHMLDIPQIGTGTPAAVNTSLPSPDRTQDSPNAGQQERDGTAPVQARGTPAATPGVIPSTLSNTQRPTTFGGGAIIGVASISRRPTIREFNHKNHYNQWLFFYDPSLDRGPETYGPTPIGLPAPIQQDRAQMTPPDESQGAN